MSRKNEILDAVIDILSTKGITGDFTMSELAGKVDIGKSTIYEYFSTKEQIVSEALLRIFEKSIEQMAMRKVDPTQSFEYNLKEELRFLFTMARGSRFLVEFLRPDNRDAYIGAIQGDFAERMKETAEQHEQMFIQIAELGFQEGVLSRDNLPMTGLLFGSLVAGSVTRMANVHKDDLSSVDMEEYIHQFYLATIKIFN